MATTKPSHGFRQRIKALWRVGECKKERGKHRCVLNNPEYLLEQDLYRESSKKQLDDDSQTASTTTTSQEQTAAVSVARHRVSASTSSSGVDAAAAGSGGGLQKTFSTDWLSPRLTPSAQSKLQVKLERTSAPVDDDNSGSYQWSEAGDWSDLAGDVGGVRLYAQPLLDSFGLASSYAAKYVDMQEKIGQYGDQYVYLQEKIGQYGDSVGYTPRDLGDSTGAYASTTLAEAASSADELRPLREAAAAAATLVRDWNKELRNALDMNRDSLERYVELTRISNDFCYAALAFAKIIIAELPLPFEQKTLKPLDFGGVAGGLKYSVSGILFKIARDVQVHDDPPFWMYGGFDGPDDEAAIRAAHGELNGAECYWSTYLPQLNVPLISLISYRGFTIIAISLLPVSRASLRYGSADGGRTVRADDPALNELMAEAGRRINLLPHTVAKTSTVISGPGDIEGHLGSDGRYYVIDFGRVMPPEAPPTDAAARQKDSRSIFYKFLRREYVSFLCRERPLCSDAFTLWDSIAEPAEAKQHAMQVRQATDHLFTVVVPQHARNLIHAAELQLATSQRLYEPGAWTSMKRVLRNYTASDLFHAVGLNCRHMGRVLSCLSRDDNASLRTVLLSNIVARTLKRKIEAQMRATMATMTTPSACFEAIIANYLNATLFNPADAHFWTAELPDAVDRYFATATTTVVDLRGEIDVALTFVSVSMLLNFAVTQACKRDLAFLPRFSIDVRDVRRFNASIRNHYALEISYADRDLMIAEQFKDPSTNARLMGYARKAFLRLKKKMPYCPILSEKLAYAYAREGAFHHSLDNWAKARNKFHKSCLHYETCINHPMMRNVATTGLFRRYLSALHALQTTLNRLGDDANGEQIAELKAEICASLNLDDTETFDELISPIAANDTPYKPCWQPSSETIAQAIEVLSK